MAAHHHHSGSGIRLLGAIVFNTAITVAEFIGGLISGYLALMADAIHNLSDVAALILAYIGEKGAARQPTKKSTYGLRRLEVMTAFASAAALVVIAAYIFYEAYQRFISPRMLSDPTLVFVVGFIGLAGNFLTVWILNPSRKQSLNIKMAFLHMIYDALSSVAVIAGAFVIYQTGWPYLDPILSVLIGLMILWSSFGVLREATMIFLEAVPSGIDLDEVAGAIARHPLVCNVHHLHIWSLSSNMVALSCHISFHEKDFNSSPETIRELNEMLRNKFGIEHSTIQAEKGYCLDEERQSFPLETGEDNEGPSGRHG
jgi:cobalt-zinc-cadmium efflux system protein